MTVTREPAADRGSIKATQDWLLDVGPREAAIHCARTHVFAETSTDTDYICSTISHDVYFGVPIRTRDGNAIPDGCVLINYDQVRGYYEGRAGSYVVLASAQLKSVATDWYLFNESAATLQGTGMIGDVDATNREWVVNSAVIFPTAPDGIRGEICVTRYPFVDMLTDTVITPPPPSDPRHYLPLREMEHTALIDRFLDALRAVDQPLIESSLAPDHTMAVRLDDVRGNQLVLTSTTSDAASHNFVTMFDGASDLTLVCRIATEWYIFAEYLLHFDDGRVRRLALTHPVEGGKLTGTFGYGRDEQKGH
ncbi:MAG: hypothetical protein E6G39_05350 [Actinobacteria bacterium]|nr:MAG: hypothetical protein E6G39_05350 [Actinomycetota bacterium]